MHHAGDLGNIDADDKGHAHVERSVAGLTIAGDRNPILGRAVIIHASEDDFTTQPTGNAGDRIGCGVIGIAKPAAPAAK
jgi:superoxide dismutase, Cu-Zn family